MKPFEATMLTPIEEGLLEGIMLAKSQRKAVVEWITTNNHLQGTAGYDECCKLYDNLTTIINRLESASNEVRLVSVVVGRMA